MPIELTREAMLAFRQRRWDLVRAAKQAYWAEDTRTRGPAAGFAAEEAMWQHAREIDPTWPSPSSRQTDLEHHIQMCARLRRVADAFARR
jgi:hypothetical protein